MLEYKGENHGLRKPENMKDYTVRMKEYFDHYLMDKPAPMGFSAAQCAARAVARGAHRRAALIPGSRRPTRYWSPRVPSAAGEWSLAVPRVLDSGRFGSCPH